MLGFGPSASRVMMGTIKPNAAHPRESRVTAVGWDALAGGMGKGLEQSESMQAPRSVSGSAREFMDFIFLVSAGPFWSPQPPPTACSRHTGGPW